MTDRKVGEICGKGKDYSENGEQHQGYDTYSRKRQRER